ncbi:MAG: UDP-N-acetylmuramate dehydrogenase [Candidatus Omnitrophota bacterium]
MSLPKGSSPKLNPLARIPRAMPVDERRMGTSPREGRTKRTHGLGPWGSRKDVSLARHTSFRIGGTAGVWYEPKDQEELAWFLKGMRRPASFFVVGAGSNLLVKDGPIRKTFIHLDSPAFKKISVCGTRVEAGAGVLLSRLVSELKKKDLCGHEFLAGIPGTVGGAIVTNAGVRAREMKDLIEEVQVVDGRGRRFWIPKARLKFSYRSSNLKPYIVVGCRLRLKRGDHRNVQANIRHILRDRFARQDRQYPSAGSFFKNPSPDLAAGWLIDCCGLKGKRVGGAQVSVKHANFIVNIGRAKSTDVLKLMEIVQRKVYNRFKIKLKPEVEIVG